MPVFIAQHAAILLMANPFVRLSVCHTQVLDVNDCTYLRTLFAIC